MSVKVTHKEKEIWDALSMVKDPEIPVISVVDMGIITGIHLDDDAVRITMTPTFVGCPAIDYMRKDIQQTVENLGYERVEVEVDFKTKWSSNLITEKGKAQLKDFGLAPPPRLKGNVEIENLENVQCPKCGSTNTTLNNPFGPTLCRSVHKCNDCGEAFEQFKPI